MIKPPPDRFQGTISSFVDEYVVPNFPPADRLLAWTEALLAYHRREDAICVIRGSAPRGSPRVWPGATVVLSDNSPGRWVHLRAMDGTVQPEEIGDRLDRGRIPVLYAARSDEKPTWTYGLAMSARDKAAHSNPSLKHCHIAAARDGAPSDPRALALRNLCPVNHFLFPSPRSFSHHPLGWTEDGRGAADLGESLRVVAVVRARMEEHLGPAGAAMFSAFDTAIGGTPLSRRMDESMILIVRRAPETGNSDQGLATSRTSPAHTATVNEWVPEPAGPVELAGSRGFWQALFSYAGSDDRREILRASPAAHQRIARLQSDIDVEQLVGLGNAWFNKCNPSKLRVSHPGQPEAQAEAALRHLEQAKREPSLGGKWALAVAALRPAQSEGLDHTRRLGFDAFLRVLRGVESCVYRAME